MPAAVFVPTSALSCLKMGVAAVARWRKDHALASVATQRLKIDKALAPILGRSYLLGYGKAFALGARQQLICVLVIDEGFRLGIKFHRAIDSVGDVRQVA